MKRIINLAAMAAMLVAGVSCNKEPQVEPSVPSHGDFMKTISVDLGGSTRTRAASALSGEAAIEDATLFVWQHNGKTDETILYEKTYGEASTFEFNLLFSDQTDFTYTINAWANMGELASEPQDGEVLFSGEESTGLQMKGSKSGIDQSSASSVTIDMKRYVGKITVSEVALAWTNKQNALQEFTLKSIYVANAGDKAEGAVATYNVDGAYVSSSMDAMLYSPVSSVIADGAKYDTPQMMYAYGSGTTELVLECDLGGQTMYYHVPYEPEANTHRAFKLTVRQAGAETPLGELPEEAIEVNVTTLNVLGFEDSDSDVEFGEAGSNLTYNMVDLGLPSGLKWADRNVGAVSPEDVGLYFQWGDTVGWTKEQIANGDKVFDFDNYWDSVDGTSRTYNKYGSSSSIYTLQPEDDAATVHMGESWRIPTAEDVIELFRNTEQVLVYNDSYELVGLRLSGNNGNSIYIPAKTEYGGSCWTSDFGYRSYIHVLFFDHKESMGLSSDGIDRFEGCPVRGVK